MQHVAVAPTGSQHEIRCGRQRATVVEVGGGIRDYRVDGRAVLDGYAEDESPDGARGQVLVPWPNRLGDGRYVWDGEEQQLPLTEPAARNAIHGLCRWVNWGVEEDVAEAVTMRYELFPQPGWPFTLLAECQWTLADDGLHVEMRATNIGRRPCPYGAGVHPYLTVGTPTVDGAELHVPADMYYPTDDRGLPTGRAPVDGTDKDLRERRRIGGRQIDVAYTGLHRDADGRFRVRLSDPDGPAVALWLGEGFDYVQIFTGDSLPPGKRRTGLGVEPMTCAPDAFRTGDGLVRLEPGATHVVRWGIEPGW